jgi:hypothetical protein
VVCVSVFVCVCVCVCVCVPVTEEDGGRRKDEHVCKAQPYLKRPQDAHTRVGFEECVIRGSSTYLGRGR